MAWGDRLKQILMQIQGGAENLMLGPSQTADDAPGAIDMMSAEIAEDPHPQGFAAVLSQLARQRGRGRLAQLGSLKDEQKATRDEEDRQLNRQATGANINQSEAMTDKIRTETGLLGVEESPKNEFEAWQRQNPGAPVGDYLRMKVETERNPTEFAEWRRQNPDAPVGDYVKMVAEAGREPEQLIPGRDTPYSPDVFEQLIKLRETSNAASGGPGGSYQMVTDPQGRIVGAWNPAANDFIPAPTEGLRRGPAPAGEREELANSDQMVKDLNTLEGLAENNQNAIGWLDGPLTRVKRRTVGVSDDVNNIFRISGNLSDQLLRLRSGAAISPGEYDRLLLLVPDPNQPYSTFMSNLKGFRAELESVLALRRGNVPPGETVTESTTVPLPGAGPKVGEVRTSGGVQYRFDGTNWVEVQ